MWSTADDGALRALFWFLDGNGEGEGATLPDGPRLFLGAVPGDWVGNAVAGGWLCEQPFAPFARSLQGQGIDAQPRVDATGVAVALVLPPRQRDAARALIARAARATRAGGIVVAAAGNNDGARSLESDMRSLFGSVHADSKHKSRVVRAIVGADKPDAGLLAQWLALAEPCRVGEGENAFWSRPGLFAWDRIDPASALLASQLPATLGGRVADLGAGWGYLSMHILRACPGVTAIDLYEANAAAIEPARRNLEALCTLRPDVRCEVHWQDISAGMPDGYDVVVSNPPFHIGRADAPELGRAFIATAAAALEPRGEAWFVANRHLPYEALLAERFRTVTTPAQRDGFKVLHAREPRR